jgi:hypothetical protein
LLVTRAEHAEPGDLRSVAWLAQADRLVGADRGLRSAVHTASRTHRVVDPPAFDDVWRRATGGAPPGWLAIDAALLALAGGWIATASYEEERDHLSAHPELLDSDADAAVDEALLAVGEEEASRYSALRAAARADGAHAAYEPLLLGLLAHRFIGADVDAQRALLAERRAELLHNRARAAVDDAAADGNAPAVFAAALLDLAARGDEGVVFDAIDEPPRRPELLLALAQRAEPETLRPAATVLYMVAADAGQAATALFYLAVAQVLGDPDADPAPMLREARATDPTGVAGWVAALAAIGRTHPAVLSLIAPLMAPADPADDNEGKGAAGAG